MTTTRTSTSRRTRLGRRAAVAVLAGAGIALTPLPAHANSSGGGSTSSSVVAPAPAAPVAAASSAAQVAVDTALAQIGDPYAWGGSGPNAFDCSGLMQYSYAAAGISLPRTSSIQATVGTPVSFDALQPGDLLFFYSPVSHVGMYIGNGQMVHSSTYGQPVKVIDLDYMPGLTSARRVA